MGLSDFFNQQQAEKTLNADPSNPQHESHLSHELISSAAAFAATKAYERHQASQGQVGSHNTAKALLASLAAAEVDKLIESKGLNWVDAQKAKHDAQKQAEQALNQSGQFQ